MVFSHMSKDYKKDFFRIFQCVSNQHSLFLFLILNIGISVGLIMLVLYFVMMYMTTIVSGYVLGNVISTKLIKKETNTYIQGLLGILALTILSFIPYFGSLINIITILFGFGVIIKMLKNRENRTL